MEFWGDDRGQSIQVGAILLFGFLVIALTTYQTTVVPQQNAEIEYNHNQAVGMDMLDLRNDLLTAGRTGRTTATTVQLGTRYPARAVFINPPPPSGNIETVGTSDESVNVTIGNATADGDVGDYWNGSDRAFNTGAIVYSPNYNEYQNAPDTGIDTGTGVVFNAQQDAKIPTTDQQLIQGNRINLVLLAGDLSKGGSYATSLDVRSVSSSENTVEIDSDQNVTITLATRLSVEHWEDLTSEERVLTVEPAGSVDEEFDRIRLVLEPGNYELSVSKVSVGTVGSEGQTAAVYLTAVSGDSTVSENTEQTVRFELRDELNNPTGERNVTISINNMLGCVYIDNPSSCRSTTTANTSEHDGKIDVQYRAPDNIDGNAQSVTMEATFDDNSSAAERAQVNLTVVNIDGSGTGNNGGGGVPGSDGSGNEYVAFNDTNGDGQYQSGETRYTASDLNGYSNPNTDLVIADSLSTNDKISIDEARSFTVKDRATVSSKNDFTVSSDVGDTTIGGTVESRNGKVTLDPEGQLDINSGALKAKNEIKLSPEGALSARGATMESSNGKITIVPEGSVDITDGAIKAKNEVSIDSIGALDARRTTIESTNGKVSLSATNGIDLRQSTVQAKNERSASLDSENTQLQVEGMEILDQAGNAATLNAEVEDDDQVVGEPSIGEVES
ncbi:hypothetical protein [Halolamina sediminis]|uniref:hypothetical protein n=1 Tax=Halolamina sediminis TaxID=1480675 RepID=UPI0006B578A5|nr:hypothetical protein [Halolamina sediminis]